jgi:hypothetical protein
MVVLLLLEEEEEGRSLLAAVLKRAEEEQALLGNASVVAGKVKDKTGFPSEEIAARRAARHKPFIRRETERDGVAARTCVVDHNTVNSERVTARMMGRRSCFGNWICTVVGKVRIFRLFVQDEYFGEA